MPRFSLIGVLVTLLLPLNLFAHPWAEHRADIQDLERNIYKFEQELDVLVEKKKKTREKARIEQTLTRIVEIHAELISLRKKMDNTREHLKDEHPDYAHVLDDYDSRMSRYQQQKNSYRSSPLSKDLDMLLIKVQLKFSSFIRTEKKNKNIEDVEEVVAEKMKKKKEREADVYLRHRSKVKLVK